MAQQMSGQCGHPDEISPPGGNPSNDMDLDPVKDHLQGKVVLISHLGFGHLDATFAAQRHALCENTGFKQQPQKG